MCKKDLKTLGCLLIYYELDELKNISCNFQSNGNDKNYLINYGC